MFTYIIKSQEYYKIGRTTNMENRIRSYDTHNPCYKITLVFSFDCETYLRNYFINKRFKNDWYNLTNEDIQWIINNEEFLKTKVIYKKCDARCDGSRGKLLEEFEKKENIINFNIQKAIKSGDIDIIRMKNFKTR